MPRRQGHVVRGHGLTNAVVGVEPAVAVCECGARSGEPLGSPARRVRWASGHRADVRLDRLDAAERTRGARVGGPVDVWRAGERLA